MKNITILLLILNLFIICSCSKEKQEIDFNFGNYSTMEIELGDVRLFTKNGEINNKQLIESYVARKNIDFITKEKNLEMTEDIKIEFLTDSTVIFKSQNKSQTRNIIYKDNIIYFEDQNITNGNKNANKINEFNLYSPLYYVESNSIQTTSLDVISIEYKHCIYGKYSNNKITIPSIYISLSTYYTNLETENSEPDFYLLSNSTGTHEISRVFAGGLLNDFDERKISKLTDNEYYTDTLAVQNRNYILKR